MPDLELPISPFFALRDGNQLDQELIPFFGESTYCPSERIAPIAASVLIWESQLFQLDAPMRMLSQLIEGRSIQPTVSMLAMRCELYIRDIGAIIKQGFECNVLKARGALKLHEVKIGT